MPRAAWRSGRVGHAPTRRSPGDTSPRLPARNEPVGAGQVEARQLPEQRLGADEAHRRTRGPQKVSAERHRLFATLMPIHTFGATRATARYRPRARAPSSASGTFATARAPRLEHLRDVVERQALVKEIAHRVDEDHLRLARRQGAGRVAPARSADRTPARTGARTPRNRSENVSA